ncbi:hypothetical protein CK203_071056 [Vitis vinifera]|uniref:Uncharacterized protein n=1 Tax=Vitis vinifera TaxID=29760 RepID=A0A438E9A4_VITVI|nr:hypothetical protein CK203_071056 [Vitis vinifera]
MSDSIARSLGSRRFLDWKAANAEGLREEFFICWDRRSLDILDWEEGQFTLSCRFPERRKWGYLGFTGVERSSQRRTSLAMRKFAEIVDDLGWWNLPLQGENLLGMGAKIIRLWLDWTGSLCLLAG